MTGPDTKYTGMIAEQSVKGYLTCRKDGYCGHEHLPAFNLLNMNARLYDPWAARFLSPDPYVQLPDFTQSLNRYSYCLNNPLKYYDYNGKKFDYSGLSSQEYVSYMSNIQILLNNSLFRFIYDKLKSSTNTYHVKFDHNGDYIDNPDLSDAIYLDSENTLYLGGSCTSWTISEELYHAFQDDNNLSNAPYNLELEANFAALLMTNGIGGTTYKSFENRIVDYACYKYGDSSKNELITYDKIDVIIRDYLEIGQTFIYDRPEFKKYTIPVDSFPSLLFNLLTTVYN